MSFQIEKIDDHKEQATNKVFEQYKNADKTKAVIEAFAKQIQELEDAIYTLYGIYDINDVRGGIILDIIGEIVGQKRLNFDDEKYRLLIKARIGVNVSRGTPNEIINIFKLIIGYEEILYIHVYPAAVKLQGKGPPIPIDLVVLTKESIKKALPAGVDLTSIISFEDEPFKFSSNDESQIGDNGFNTGKFAKIN